MLGPARGKTWNFPIAKTQSGLTPRPAPKDTTLAQARQHQIRSLGNASWRTTLEADSFSIAASSNKYHKLSSRCWVDRF
eukprot:5223108-Amphidinium_carterae.1